MLATMAVVPLHQSGRASGRVMVGFLGGLGLTPPLFGAAVDRVGSYTPCWIALAVVAAVAAAAMVLWSRLDRRGSTPRPR
jgi:nitrate/nitrite transporter NarK